MAWRKISDLIELRGSASMQRSWFDFLAKGYIRRLRSKTSWTDKVLVATGRSPIRSNQRPSEVLALMESLVALAPRTICEIGCDRGGTLSLFAEVAAPDALIVSIDPMHCRQRSEAFRFFARDQQRLVRMAADSHLSLTLAQVRQELAGRPLDFLFIDGDHSFQGVARDYRMYAPLLREGGLLAFHDICPDAATRSGGSTASASYAGGVPRFFHDHILSQHHAECFVDDPRQDGYGIGLVRWPGDRFAKRLLQMFDECGILPHDQAA